jgi:hypothetical protein
MLETALNSVSSFPKQTIHAMFLIQGVSAPSLMTKCF